MSFRKCSKNTEDYDCEDENTISLNESVILFPSRSEGRDAIKDVYLLPSKVQQIYEEIIKALNNDQPVLAGIGIRALLETICKDKNALGKSLLDKIDNLVSMQFLTKDGALILHKIRTLGNDAAHEAKPHSPKQLCLALDICEHLLQGVYILPHYAKQTFK